MGERLDYLSVCVQAAQEKIDNFKKIDREEYNTIRSYDVDDMEAAKQIIKEYKFVFKDDFKFTFNFPRISINFVWFDLWIGAYISKKTIYICIVPTIVLKIQFK